MEHLGCLDLQNLNFLNFSTLEPRDFMPITKDSIENKLILNISPHKNCNKYSNFLFSEMQSSKSTISTNLKLIFSVSSSPTLIKLIFFLMDSWKFLNLTTNKHYKYPKINLIEFFSLISMTINSTQLLPMKSNPPIKCILSLLI